MHYKKHIPIGELFEQDRVALLPLPHHRFDVCRDVYIKANGYEKVRINGDNLQVGSFHCELPVIFTTQ
ncbi:MAG: hypothetical protein JJE17_08670 [Peptostreptococcaceae bacterium]|nr:hypothetical protein [Peptostreptococcaceae bacterium]